jgi:tetratricopeptide (TPR) repeat protein
VEFQSDLAYALWWVGNYPDALETYFTALEKAEALNDTISMGSIYNGIATVYRNEGNYRQAINYYSKTEDITKLLADNPMLYSAKIDKGKAYEQLDILDSAYSYLQDWLAKKYQQYKGKNVIGGGGEAEMGIIYSKMGKKQLADDFFRQSFQLNKEIKEFRLLARGYNEFAEHFARYHQNDSAIYYATEGFLLDKQNNFLVQQLAASTLLSKLYTQENQIDSAFKYQQAMVTLKDSVFSSEKISRLQTLGFNEQLRQQERETERIEAENKRYENIQYALISIGLITFIILFLLLSRKMITSPKLIRFLGVVSLLLVFEFINLVLHPYLEEMTHHSPVLMLISLVCIAALLVPLHHRLEHWTTEKLVEKNKKIRLTMAKKTIEKLEGKVS